MDESSNGKNNIKDRNALKVYINNLKSKIEQLEESLSRDTSSPDILKELLADTQKMFANMSSEFFTL